MALFPVCRAGLRIGGSERTLAVRIAGMSEQARSFWILCGICAAGILLLLACVGAFDIVVIRDD